MIRIEHLTKSFETHKKPIVALNDLSLTIPSGSVFGLIGSNGAGKSTLLRLLAGVYKPDKGSVLLDGAPIYDNPCAKEQIFFIPDDFYYMQGASLDKMAKLYRSFYKTFDTHRYQELKKQLDLDGKTSLSSLSKGTRRRAVIALGLAAMPRILLLDETFDGLDPVMRNLVKKVIYNDVAERGVTAIITSHSLRELEDTCDRLALLHSGGIVLESDIENLQTMLLKVQVAFSEEYDISRFEGINILDFNKKGSVANMIVRGDREEVQHKIFAMCPLLCEILPLTLEEVFIYELEAKGYAFDELLIGSDDVM